MSASTPCKGSSKNGTNEGSERMERFFTPEKPWEAHVLCDLLEEAGIAARVVNGDFPHAEGIGPAEVWVLDANDAVARDVLKTYLERERHPTPTSATAETAKRRTPRTSKCAGTAERSSDSTVGWTRVPRPRPERSATSSVRWASSRGRKGGKLSGGRMPDRRATATSRAISRRPAIDLGSRFR
jgi:hypothetical protein